MIKKYNYKKNRTFFKKEFAQSAKVHSSMGFTLIELLVTISIMAVISTLLFWNSDQFTDKLVASSVAEDVSLAIRQAQSYGSSVKEDTAGSGQFGFPYGIDFDLSHPTYFILFVDQNNNGKYDGDSACVNGGGDICVQKVILRNSVKIKSLCVTNGAGSCLSANVNSIQVTFTRPSLNAMIGSFDTTGASIVGGPWFMGNIVLVSPGGATKTVSVNNIGQINIQ